MVRMPSEIVVRILTRRATPEGDIVRFEVRNSEGEPAVSNGLVALHA
jgi:hypothetical protein